MADIDDRLAALEQELAALRAQLVARGPVARVAPAAAPPSVPLTEEVNRRSLLRKSAGALAGAAAGGVALAVTQAAPAAATVGAMQFGTSNNAGSDETGITSSATTATLSLLNTASGGTSPHPQLTLSPNTSDPIQPNGGPTGSLLARFSQAPTTIFSVDGYADLYFAHRGADKAPSIPRSWGKVHTSANSNYLQFLTVPVRVVDTRRGAGTKLGDQATTVFTLSDAPANAVGFTGTVTVTGTAGGTYVSVYNGDVATITDMQFSHVNAESGQTLATGLTVGFGTAKKIKVYTFLSCHVIIDVAAWVVTGG